MRSVQHPRGNTSWNDAQIFDESVMTYDTQTGELRLHDGVTPGGHKVPNTNTIPTLNRQFLTAGIPNFTDTTINVGDVDKMLTISAGGTYVLPDRDSLMFGAHLVIYAAVAGVTIQGYSSGQQIRDKAAQNQDRSMNQYETIHLVLVSLTGTLAWHVVSSY